MKFCNLHPFTLIVYFASVIALTMVTMNPILLLLSLFGALFSTTRITGKINLGYYIIFFLVVSITNPLFSHNGETVLFHLFDQRITLEALFYGMSAGLLLITVMSWFRLFGYVFTEDKLTWLIGKISPKLCVIFCMSLRFIPLFKENAKSIYNAQISMGIFKTNSLHDKIKLVLNVFSALVSLSIENAIETADTMRSRGYENKKRSSYSLLLFSKKDLLLSILVVVLDVILVYLLISGEGYFSYYPAINFNALNSNSLAFYTQYAFLCIIPSINDILEDIKWKYLISKI